MRPESPSPLAASFPLKAVLLPHTVLNFLRDTGLVAADESPAAQALAGGVSSDIWRVDTARGPLCVKRALPRLRVAQVWEAPVVRNAYECAWLRAAGEVCPAAAPRILAEGEGVFAMEYLDPSRYPVWKRQLQSGAASAAFAAEVGARLAAIHGATAGREEVARRFPTDDIFYAIRLEPYLVASAAVHPDLAQRLLSLVERTRATKRCLVHGDVSPKNILAGPSGPVFLDAECAWYGDPAFDLAFCLNHMLLKCLWTPSAAAGFLESFDALVRRYLEGVSWEPPAALEARAASLLPGLFLARVDGKSPVEYLTEERQKDPVRRCARGLLAEPPSRLMDIREQWQRFLQ